MWTRFGLIVISILALVSPARAQTTTGAVAVRDSATPTTIVNAGNASDSTMRVHIIASDVGGSGGTSSNFGSALPSAGTAVGFSDGTNMQAARVFDLDSGAGTQYGLGVNLRRSASGGSAELIGSSTSANSIPVVIASDQGAVPISAASALTTKLARASSATLANVAGSASSVAVLASNSNRNGATVFNDSTVALYLKFGATASNASFTVKVDGGGFFVIDPSYTGQIDGIWASATGNARVTEW